MTMSFDFHRIERIEVSETNSHAGDAPFHCRDLKITHRDHLDTLVETSIGLYTNGGEAALEVQANLDEFKDACDELEWAKAELNEVQGENTELREANAELQRLLESANEQVRRLDARLEALGVVEI